MQNSHEFVNGEWLFAFFIHMRIDQERNEIFTGVGTTLFKFASDEVLLFNFNIGFNNCFFHRNLRALSE